MSILWSGVFPALMTEFNEDISRWNVSSVKNMARMFCEAYSFNQPLNDWDISNVKYTQFMFSNTENLINL